MSGVEIREYNAEARSTDVFGRVLCSAREHHFVIDGPVWNGCPGEEVTPGEAFLGSVAACGVELVEALAAQEGLAAPRVKVAIHGVVDRDDPVRDDLTVFNRVRIAYELEGVTAEQAEELVEGVGRRCPLYGSLAAATPDLQVDVHVR